MMARFLLPLVVGLVALTAPAAHRPPTEETQLFNGKDLDGWVVEGDKEYKEDTTTKPVWIAENGQIRNRVVGPSYGFLRYAKQEFGDFALHFEYRFHPPADAKDERGNSGVGIRTVPFDPKNADKTRPSGAAYEVQLLDDADRKADKHSTGSLYNYVAPTAVAAKPGPEWNSIDIECKGPHIQITINGKKVLDVDQSTDPAIKDKPLKGYISLQNHGGRIDFRNIHIRDLSR
jgi:Domain of Unknown Function (DUF1080)